MRQSTSLYLLIALLMLAGLSANAQPTPDITSFSTSAATVSRRALDNRTARVPVSWTTANRPLFANLAFEQVLPDGAVVNVELPRAFPWVNSSGDGLAAPVLPAAAVGAVELRVTLYNIFDNSIYDRASLTLPIVEGGDGGPGVGTKPAIISFATTAPTINRLDLDAGRARIPVTWTAINRPITATLIFEQVKASGEAVNVELPRETPWVNSRDRGVVAPVSEGVSHSEILLRVRLYDLLHQRLYDVRYLTVQVQEPVGEVVIRQFNTTTGWIDPATLPERIAVVDVAWDVANRPSSSNLVFEQIITESDVRNVELPRDFVIVPSSGAGFVRPFAVTADAEALRFQLRVVDLGTRATLARAEFTLPIRRETTETPPAIGIRSFVVSPERPASNAAVTLRWELEGTTRGRIEWNRVAWEVPHLLAELTTTSGQLDVTLPDEFRTYTFTLVAIAENGAGAPITQEIRVEPTCPYALFVSDASLSALRCPRGEAQTVSAVYQPFERGMLLWVESTEISRPATIYALFADGSVLAVTDTWDGNAFDLGTTPPDGLFAPERGFGWAWSQNAAIRDGLGWATSTEQSYSATRQGIETQCNRFMSAAPLYQTLRDGRVIRYNADSLCGAPVWSALN